MQAKTAHLTLIVTAAQTKVCVNHIIALGVITVVLDFGAMALTRSAYFLAVGPHRIENHGNSRVVLFLI